MTGHVLWGLGQNAAGHAVSQRAFLLAKPRCRCASCGPAIGVDRLPSGPICDVALPAVDVAAYLASHPTYRRDRAAKIEAEGLPASAEQA